MVDYLEQTQRWVTDFVIGLHLCPFAAGPARAGRIRYVLETTAEEEKLAETLLEELSFLLEQPREQVETTLIVHPNVLTDFEDYLYFIGWAEDLLAETGLEGIIQIATFHPDYQFADAEPDDPANATNRSPYPMLHLLREESVEEAVRNYPNVEEIPERNARFLRGRTSH